MFQVSRSFSRMLAVEPVEKYKTIIQTHQCRAVTLKKSNIILITRYSHCNEICYSYMLLYLNLMNNILYYILLIVQNNSLGNNITFFMQSRHTVVCRAAK